MTALEIQSAVIFLSVFDYFTNPPLACKSAW